MKAVLLVSKEADFLLTCLEAGIYTLSLYTKSAVTVTIFPSVTQAHKTAIVLLQFVVILCTLKVIYISVKFSRMISKNGCNYISDHLRQGREVQPEYFSSTTIFFSDIVVLVLFSVIRFQWGVTVHKIKLKNVSISLEFQN